jgi:hypothetical protein
MKDRHQRHYIPVFDVYVEIVVCSSVSRAHNTLTRQKRLTGVWTDDEVWGLCCNSGENIAIFLHRNHLSHDLIAHEVMHAVHAILETTSIAFGPNCDDEVSALLCGYVTKLVYKNLQQWGHHDI